jgi:pentatricopeptide repeat protein
MESFGLRPRPVTYSLLVDESARGGDWKKCFRIINEMVDKGIKFPFAAFDVAASACRAAGRHAELKQLVSLVSEDTLLGAQPDREGDAEARRRASAIAASEALRYGSAEKEPATMSYYELLAHADFEAMKAAALDDKGRHIGVRDGTAK